MNRKLLQVHLALLLAITGSSAAVAQTMSLAEQQVEAQRLKSLCGNDPTVRRWMQQAESGSVAATYEAAAAMIQCFYNNVDSRYPSAEKQKWLDAIAENKARARELQ